MIILARSYKLVPDKPVSLKAVRFISLRKFSFVFNTLYLMINYLAALGTDLKEFYKLGKKLAYIKIWNTINFFDLYAYSLEQTERIRKL